MLHEYYRKLVGGKVRVEFLGQVYCMSSIAETDFFVLGPGILYQHVAGLEIDRSTVVENRPDALGRQYLLGLVIFLVGLLEKHHGFGSAQLESPDNTPVLFSPLEFRNPLRVPALRPLQEHPMPWGISALLSPATAG